MTPFDLHADSCNSVQHPEAGEGKVVVGYAQPELAIRTAIDDRPANSVADLDELPGCTGCGKKVRVVIE